RAARSARTRRAVRRRCVPGGTQKAAGRKFRRRGSASTRRSCARAPAGPGRKERARRVRETLSPHEAGNLPEHRLVSEAREKVISRRVRRVIVARLLVRLARTLFVFEPLKRLDGLAALRAYERLVLSVRGLEASIRDIDSVPNQRVRLEGANDES